MDDARGSGCTLQMVRTLPGNAVVIVHSAGLADYVRRMIKDVRGGDFAAGCSVRIVRNAMDAEQHLTGLNRPVVFDHAWSGPESRVTPHAAALARELAAGVNQYVGMRRWQAEREQSAA